MRAAAAQVVNRSLLTTGNMTEFGYASVEEAFPEVDPGMEPFGTMCIFQIRHPRRRTKSGIELPDEARSTEHYNTQVGRCVKIGPLCFKSLLKVPGELDRLVAWSEGPWFKVGDFCRLPKYGGDRFTAPFQYEDFEVDQRTGHKEKLTVKDDIIFAIFKSSDVLAKITGDPLSIKSYLD